ncbi:hypothetical protein ABVT39_025369 [Epinephelus coioides]
MEEDSKFGEEDGRSIVTSSFISEIKGELASIEQLIPVLLQWQTKLGSRLASLELSESTGLPVKVNRPDTVDPSPGCSTWASVVKNKKRLSLPLCDSEDDSTDLELCNFTPLAALPQLPSLLLNVDCVDRKRKTTPCVISPSDKRPQLCTSLPENSGRAPAASPRATVTPAVLQPPPGLSLQPECCSAGPTELDQH